MVGETGLTVRYRRNLLVSGHHNYGHGSGGNREVAPVSRQEPAAEGGTYTLLVQLDEPGSVTVGSLGEVAFPAGWYAYTGSAMGAGGFARVERHRELAAGERDVRHWHVDYLLGQPSASVDLVTCSGRVDAECQIAARIEGERVPDFGASDCACPSHLVHAERRDALIADVTAAHRRERERRDD